MKTQINGRLISWNKELDSFIKQLLAHDKYGIIGFHLNLAGEPEFVTIDNKDYDIKSPWQREKVLRHIASIDVAASMAEASFTSFEKMSDQINPFIYKFHPRWIMFRGNKPKNSFRKQFKLSSEIKTVGKWKQFFWHSVGVNALELSNVSDEETMTMDEFMQKIPESIWLTLKAFQKRKILGFLQTSEVDMKIATKLKKCIELLDGPVDVGLLNSIIETTNKAMAEIDYEGYVKAHLNTERIYCKPYHTAFTRTYEIQAKEKDHHVGLGEAADGFVVLTFRKREYDLREPGSLERLNIDMQNYVRKLRGNL